MRIATYQIWVHDQDEALAYWTQKVGFEVRQDVTVPELGNFRWLSVAPPGQDDVAIVLMAVPGAPVFDDQTRSEILSLTGKGACTAVFLSTDDVMRDYEAMSARGVDFTDKPTEQIYGIDCGFRDPSGNNVRLSQLRANWG
jgi:uncharacterized glyoxalase superfamily protein PhnB